MTDVDTEVPVPDNPVFSPDDSLETLWVKAYQGEVLGEVLFEGIAHQQRDSERTRKMLTLAKLERCTKEALVPAMERAGLSTDPAADTLELAQVLVEASASIAWEDTMASLGPTTSQFSAMYVRIGELAPAEHETADLLVAHEAAIAAFGRKELAGDLEGSLVDIEALPHVR
ncbi:MAG TPA: hypothetical protein VGG38_08125 [Acidimicrobiales bacterium]|jgi:hypothetical protein